MFRTQLARCKNLLIDPELGLLMQMRTLDDSRSQRQLAITFYCSTVSERAALA